MTKTAQPTPDGAAVRLTGLRKSFGEVHAVAGVDLHIAPGEVVALLGPNGAGKSTTVDMLLGLTAPDGGSAQIFGRAPRKAIADGLVGAMLQDAALLEDVTVAESVTLVAALHRDPMPVADALAAAGVADLAGRRCAKLSGGQRQRTRFAMALVCDPDLLVLDEPTVAMDVETRRDFWRTMHKTGRTVLFATHYLDEAEQFADRVVLMREGRVIADGSVADIRAHVTGRRVTALVDRPDTARLGALPGVTDVAVRGEQVTLTCADSDQALRALLATEPSSRDIEITAMSLEDAFLALTTEGAAR
ncbi:ABC transporter ATP-binding protein [Phytomonospora sp. NPDC050363]|uniref:ABC transporter ATP-binding protein n=1 Tax=Phytomonospora sp. NPDC050363 TaxID=3155642 RepID=UPI0034004348